jgi:hypothetical protein
MSAEPTGDCSLRADQAQQALERTRHEAAALFESFGSNRQVLQFPRSAVLRWVLSNMNIRMGGPLAVSVASSVGRLFIRRLFTRRRARGFE